MGKWGDVADIVRLLANYNQLDLSDTESEVTHDDLANIMDYMIMKKCKLNKAIELYRQEDSENALWIERALELI